jgi:hypothetical protein
MTGCQRELVVCFGGGVHQGIDEHDRPDMEGAKLSDDISRGQNMQNLLISETRRFRYWWAGVQSC